MKFGNGLQRKYLTNPESDVVSDAEKTQKEKDHEALRTHAESRRAQREARMVERDTNRKSITEDCKEQIKLVKRDEKDRLIQLENNKENRIENQVKEAKEKTNHLARKHGLEEPNNPEALKHDRYHCYKCDMKLHIPDAYKQLPKEVQQLFEDDNEVRHLCCFCFGKMEDGEITKLQDKESDRKIRMAIYNPEIYVRENAEESHQTDVKQIHELTKERIVYYNSKIKKYEHVISLVGTVKHDNLQEVDDLENTVRNHAFTRYNYGDR